LFLLPIFIFATFVFGLVPSSQSTVYAATNSTLNFQGRLLSNTGGLVNDGSYNIQFDLYTVASGGTSEWTETRINLNAQGVTVQNGYFSVNLGDVTAFGAGINWDQEHWLGMTVRGTGSCAPAACTPTDAEMTPRFKLTAVPYAFRAGAVLDAAGTAFTGDDLVQATPGAVQALNAAVSAIRLNQAGAGGLLQLQGSGADVFTVASNGDTNISGGLTLGTSAIAGTVNLQDGIGNGLTLQNGTQTGNLTFTLPGNYGTANQCLKTDGTGILTFEDCPVGSITVVKTLDEPLTTSTTLQDDNELTFNALANEVWTVEFTLQATSNTTADYKFAVTAPAGSTCYVGANNIEGAQTKTQKACGVSTGNMSSVNNTDNYKVIATVNVGATAGPITLQWAQNTASGTTTVHAGSFLKATEEGGGGGAGGGGGGANSFVQNGNAFGTTAVLGTTDLQGLNIITNNSTALAFTSAGAATFNNGLSISSGDLTLSGANITGTAALTLASGGVSDLTLDSASNVLYFADATLRRSAAGTTTFDLLDASADTTLSVTNSDGTRVADLSVEGTISAANISGNGSGITNLDGSNVASGTISDARLSSNVVLLNASQTFTGLPTYSSGLVLGNSASTTAGTTRWSGTDFEGFDGIQWLSLTSGGGGGSGTLNVAFIQAYDNTGGTLVNTLTPTPIPWDTETNKDTGFTHDNAINNTRVTLDSPSWYKISYSVSATTSTAARSNTICEVQMNGTTIISTSTSYSYSRQTGDPNTTNTASFYYQTSASNEYYEVLCSRSGSAATHTAIAGKSWTIAEIATSAGSGGSNFVQGGNAFAGTAVLGTTDPNGISVITNGSLALSFTTAGAATFVNDVTISGDLVLGTPPSPDVLAQAVVFTDVATNKGLVIQGTTSQSANLFELQDNNGNILSSFDSAGGLVLGRSTATDGTILFNNSTNSNTVTLTTSAALGNRIISLPDANGTICLNGADSCGFIELGTGTVYTDATANDTLAINKTNATGNLLLLQRGGTTVFTIANNGELQINATSNVALEVNDVSGTRLFSVDTTVGNVYIGPAAADATGNLLVLDSKNTAGDPTGVAGSLYYNSSLSKFRCFDTAWHDCVGSRDIRNFDDNTSDAVVDADTTDYWDVAAENNNSHPNITASDTSEGVTGNVTMTVTSTSNGDRLVVGRVERQIGSVPSCGSGTIVVSSVSTFTTSQATSTRNISFIDQPATTSPVYYTLCSDSGTSNANGVTVNFIRFSLEEADFSN